MDPNVKAFASGVVSSEQPPYEYIPLDALNALARRMGRGVRLKPGKAWNALMNQQAADDQQFVIDRLAHGVAHIYRAIARLSGNPVKEDDEEGDGGDAGAIMFAGALLAVHVARKGRRAVEEKEAAEAAFEQMQAEATEEELKKRAYTLADITARVGSPFGREK